MTALSWFHCLVPCQDLGQNVKPSACLCCTPSQPHADKRDFSSHLSIFPLIIELLIPTSPIIGHHSNSARLLFAHSLFNLRLDRPPHLRRCPVALSHNPCRRRLHSTHTRCSIICRFCHFSSIVDRLDKQTPSGGSHVHRCSI